MNYMTTIHRPMGTRMMSDFDRVFNEVFSLPSERSQRSPIVDVRETKETYIIEAEMPGLTEEEIDIRVEKSLLIISSINTSEEKEEGFLLRERPRHAFYRSFSIPRDGDANRIEAMYRNGILTVTLHKREDAKPRKIKIKGE